MILFFGMAAWFPVLENSFGWSRAQLSWAFSLSRVEGTVTGPIGGYLIDKLGSRRMVLIGLLLLGVGFVMFSQVRELWHFYLTFAVMSTGQGLGTWLPMIEIGWEKRTPKSDKIERRRCQYERCPSRKIHEGIPARKQ